MGRSSFCFTLFTHKVLKYLQTLGFIVYTVINTRTSHLSNPSTLIPHKIRKFALNHKLFITFKALPICKNLHQNAPECNQNYTEITQRRNRR